MRLRSPWPIPPLPGILLALVFAAVPAACRAQSGDLPLVTVFPTSPAQGPLLLVLSGDGDWGEFLQVLGRQAAALGSPVLGLKSRSYLHKPRTPDEASVDLAAAVRAALAKFGRKDLIVVGYSRGAQLAPFVIARWPADLRARVRSLALIGAADWASFTFHMIDMVKEIHRPDDLPLPPEVDRLAGLPIVCVYGLDEGPGLCAKPRPGMRVLTHPGGHRVAKDDEEVSRRLLAELGLGD